jgi:nucleoid-associated protein YgaU
MGLFGHHDDDREREAVQRHREAQQRLSDARRHRELREQAETTPSRATAHQEHASFPENAWRKEFELYVVKEGDTLWGIARKVYGAGASWTRIQEANPVVLKDPDLVHPGLVLRIPKGDVPQLA